MYITVCDDFTNAMLALKLRWIMYKTMVNKVSKGSVACIVSIVMAIFSSQLQAGKARIIGGQGVDIAALPWQVAIVIDRNRIHESFICGGSIIHESWVMTAAHCAKLGARYVVVGITDLTETHSAQVHGIKRWIIHPDYVPPEDSEGKVQYNNDIALIELNRPIDFYACDGRCEVVEVVNPDNEGSVIPEGAPVIVSGWGLTDPTESRDSLASEVLQQASLNTLNCLSTQYDPLKITENMFCASSYGYVKDSCYGDSGGPLVARNSNGVGYVLAGLVSWGHNVCATYGLPGVYTRLANYSDWIESATDSDVDPDPSSSTVSLVRGRSTSGGGGGAVSWFILAVLFIFVGLRLDSSRFHRQMSV